MRFKAVGIGEVLWDLLPGGKQLGGAPANFAFHAQALGAEVRIISRLGQDEDGMEMVRRLQELGVPTECLQVDPNLPTGRVSIAVADDGQPQYTIHENMAWDRLTADENARRAIASADVVCFGTLAQRSDASRQGIRTLLSIARQDTVRVFDVNLRQHFYTREIIEESLALANALKVNDAELSRITALCGVAGDAREQLSMLTTRFKLRAAACTRGAQGALLWADGRWSEHPGTPVQVQDTVGAGDAFTAAMVLGLLADWSLDVINDRANRIAAHVASCAGATPSLPEDLRAPFLDIFGEASNR
jgi:fructokinase